MAHDRLTMTFEGREAFRRIYTSQISKGAVFVPCHPQPGVGTPLELTINVKGVGEVVLSGKVARAHTTSQGEQGVILNIPFEVADQAGQAFEVTGATPLDPSLIEKTSPRAKTPNTANTGNTPNEASWATPAPPPVPETGEPDIPFVEWSDPISTVGLPAGTVIDNRFRIEGRIGEGGMGKVYRAMHVYMQRPVALKLLHRSMSADPKVIEGFKREAQIISKIESPFVVKVYDFGVAADGTLYLAMELVEGTSLDRVLQDTGFMPPSRAVPLLVAVSEALAEAHEREVVHRDVKPSNIIMGKAKDGRDHPKVLDFGIAQLMGHVPKEDPSGPQMVVGTPGYLAPEQAVAGPIDARTDIYSLGIVAFRALTGKRPFVAPTAEEVMLMHVKTPPPRLADLKPELSAYPRLCAVVLKALEKDPAHRYPTMRAFGQALSEAHSADSNLREGLAKAPTTNQREHIARIADALREGRPNVEAVRTHLAALDASSVELILNVLEGVRHETSRSLVLGTLTTLGKQNPGPIAVRVAGANPRTAFELLNVISQFLPVDQSLAAGAALDNPNEGIRRTAISLLEACRDPSVIKHLTRALADTDGEIRLQAARALVTAAPERGLIELMRMVKAEEFAQRPLTERQSIYSVIGSTQLPGALAFFADLLRQKSGLLKRKLTESRLCAVAGLIALQGVHAYKALQAVHEDNQYEEVVRSAALKGILELRKDLAPDKAQ